MTEPNEKRSSRIWLSVLIVLLCLGGGAWFIGWYVGTPIASGPVIVGDAQVDPAPNRNVNRGQNRPNRQPAGDVRELPATSAGKRWQVRSGVSIMQVVQAAGQAASFTYTYNNPRFLNDAQRDTWMMFYRLRFDRAMADHVKLTDEQKKKLADVSTTLDMRVSDADKAKLAEAWAAYHAAEVGGKEKAAETVTNVLREVSRTSLEPTRTDFDARIAVIRSILTDEQIQAYRKQ